MKQKSKVRLDRALQEKHPSLSRSYIHSLIMQGKVSVNNVPVTKPGTLIHPDAELTLKEERPAFVSRAGHKLAAALVHFSIDLTGKVALDAGISTGGFSDCLLQRGITRIYGIDVGYGLVHEIVLNDPRLILHERTNLRYLEPLPEQVDLVTLDLSFISVTKVMPVVTRILKAGGELIVLIKPQFEAGRHQVGPGGIITDPAIHADVIKTLCAKICEQGFTHKGTIPSPLLGGSGNQEFLAYFIYCAS